MTREEIDPRETAEWWWGGKSHGNFDRIYEFDEDDDPADKPNWYGNKKHNISVKLLKEN